MWSIMYVVLLLCNDDTSKVEVRHEYVTVNTLHLFDEIQNICRIYSDSLTSMTINRISED